ncbi:hypothetical protein B0T13DRAFT_510486 [Neurospora crassa]|nr:hypothetical protein B0T13DRAFT_510486 [Neurospora crassa]
MCTKKQYLFVVCGHTEWCESQCQTKMKRTLMNPKDEEYPPPCIPVTECFWCLKNEEKEVQMSHSLEGTPREV